MQAKGVFGLISRESALVANNLLLAVAAFVVFVGTIWPLIAELAFGRKLSVGAPFFDKAFSPFMVALAIILPIGAILPWKRGRVGAGLKALWPAFALALAVAALAFTVETGHAALAPVGLALGAWLMAGAATELWLRGAGRLSRIARLPRADWGKAFAHGGLGVVFVGVAAMTAWSVEDIRTVHVGEAFKVGSYDIALTDVTAGQGPNYAFTRGEMRVTLAGAEVALLYPEKRSYPVAAMRTTEAAIKNGVFRDIYLVLGDPQADGGWAVRSYVKPFANWIWAGALMMAFGGTLSLSDRRLRLAAGATKRAPALAQPAE
jgi:cytochrome c-type biogenesis protein CcmF